MHGKLLKLCAHQLRIESVLVSQTLSMPRKRIHLLHGRSEISKSRRPMINEIVLGGRATKHSVCRHKCPRRQDLWAVSVCLDGERQQLGIVLLRQLPVAHLLGSAGCAVDGAEAV